MATKQVTGLGKQGHRVAATTADRARNERAMQGVIDRCGDVVPPGTASLTLEETQYYAGRQIQFEIESVRGRDNAHVAGKLEIHERRQERDAATAEVYGTMLLAVAPGVWSLCPDQHLQQDNCVAGEVFPGSEVLLWLKP